MNKKNSKDVSRRDFLGIAAFGTVITSFSGMIAWAARIFKPDVHYEETKRVRIDKPEQFPVGTWKMFEEERLFVFQRRYTAEMAAPNIRPFFLHINLLDSSV